MSKISDDISKRIATVDSTEDWAALNDEIREVLTRAREWGTAARRAYERQHASLDFGVATTARGPGRPSKVAKPTNADMDLVEKYLRSNANGEVNAKSRNEIADALGLDRSLTTRMLKALAGAKPKRAKIGGSPPRGTKYFI